MIFFESGLMRHRVALREFAVWFCAFVFYVYASVTSASSGAASFVYADELFRVASGGDSLILPVKILGQERLFLLDSGTGITTFDAGLLDAVGARTRVVQTFDGSEFHSSEIFKAPQFQIGGLNADLDEVEVSNLRLSRQFVGKPIMGVIGLDLLRNYAISIDYDRGEFRMHNLPLDRELAKGFRKPCVLTREPNGAILYNKLPGNVVEDIEPFLIDTGLSVSLGLKEELFDALVASGTMINLKRQQVTGAVKTREVTTSDLVGFEFAGIKHPSLRCVRLKMNLIGQALLSRYHVTMDFPRREIWFRPGKRIGEPDPTDLVGIGVLLSEQNKVEVAEVQSDSLADKSGIRPNDEIVEINGEAATKYSLFQLRLRFTKSGECRLKTRRDGELQEHRFQLAPLKTAK